MKRTTLLLHDGLAAELHRRAAAEGRTFTELVETTLRLGLAARADRRRRIALPSYDLGPFLRSPAGEEAMLEESPHGEPRP